MSTSWYYPTIDPNYTPPIKTLTPNATYTSLLAERAKSCWITEEELNNEDFDSFEFDDGCYSLYEDYCEPAVTDPVPTSRDLPASCTPAFTTEPEETATSTSKSTTVTATTAPTPTPTQPNMVNGCTEFHQVESNDECGSIASKYDISLNDFNTWNPDVGEKCNALWLTYYVCVGGPASTSTKTVTKTASSKTLTKDYTPNSNTDTRKHVQKLHQNPQGEVW